MDHISLPLIKILYSESNETRHGNAPQFLEYLSGAIEQNDINSDRVRQIMI